VGFFEKAALHTETVLERKFSAAQLVMTGVGSNSVRFSVLCLPFLNYDDNRQTLGVVVQVPKSELHWTDPLPVEVYGYAVGADGAVVDHLAQYSRLRPNQTKPGEDAAGLSFYGTLQLPPGQYTLKFMILAPDSDESGVQFMEVNVPPLERRAGFLLPPVLLDEPSRWLTLNMGAGLGGRPEFPFAVAGRALVPRTSFKIVPGTTERLALVAYEPDAPSDPVAGVAIVSSVKDASGRVYPGGPMRITRVDRGDHGRRTFLLDYLPEALPPGDYTLRVGIGSGAGRLESYSLLKVGAPTP
jgi:hypothetical protein